MTAESDDRRTLSFMPVCELIKHIQSFILVTARPSPILLNIQGKVDVNAAAIL
jgi:hypothetical protein